MPIFSLHDHDLHYELHGDSGPAIVLIHGLGSSLRDWEHQTEALAARYRVLAVDLRGHGRSSRDGDIDISIAGFSNDICALLRALGLRAYVAGISMGTAVAFQLAVDHPDHVLGLIIINGGPVGLSATDPAHQREIEVRTAAVRTHGMATLGVILGERLLPGPTHARARGSFAERWATNDPDIYLASLGALVGWTVRDRLATLTIPCGVIAADRDYTPLSFKEAYAKEIPNAELVVISDSGHMTTHDQPEALATAMLGFLDRWVTSGTARTHRDGVARL
jgi:3-oxoadipate enol-lactonase